MIAFTPQRLVKTRVFFSLSNTLISGDILRSPRNSFQLTENLLEERNVLFLNIE